MRQLSPAMGFELMKALEAALTQMDRVAAMPVVGDGDEEFDKAHQEVRQAVAAAREARGVPYDKLAEGSPAALMAMVDDGYESLARAEYGQEGSVEIDHEACISKGGDPNEDKGAYIQAWVWVSAYEAARAAYKERCIELYKCGEMALVSTYRDPHPHGVTESDEDYLNRIAEQDFNDGEHGGSVYPELREQLLKLAGYTSDDECTPGVAP
jgi:hypothetical protein